MLTGSFRVIGAGVRVGEMIQQRIRSTQGGSKTEKYFQLQYYSVISLGTSFDYQDN